MSLPRLHEGQRSLGLNGNAAGEAGMSTESQKLAEYVSACFDRTNIFDTFTAIYSEGRVRVAVQQSFRCVEWGRGYRGGTQTMMVWRRSPGQQQKHQWETGGDSATLLPLVERQCLTLLSILL